MKNLIVCFALLIVTKTLAQTCIIPAPSAPPQAKQCVVDLPGDGGTTGCTINTTVSGGVAAPGRYTIGNAKCATAVQMCNQAAAIDNGWPDGGVP